jgi:hypothetical protein
MLSGSRAWSQGEKSCAHYCFATLKEQFELLPTSQLSILSENDAYMSVHLFFNRWCQHTVRSQTFEWTVFVIPVAARDTFGLVLTPSRCWLWWYAHFFSSRCRALDSLSILDSYVRHYRGLENIFSIFSRFHRPIWLILGSQSSKWFAKENWRKKCEGIGRLGIVALRRAVFEKTVFNRIACHHMSKCRKNFHLFKTVWIFQIGSGIQEIWGKACFEVDHCLTSKKALLIASLLLPS